MKFAKGKKETLCLWQRSGHTPTGALLRDQDNGSGGVQRPELDSIKKFHIAMIV